MKTTFAILTLAFCAFSNGALADEPRLIHELKLGLLAHDVDSLWSGSSRESGTDFNIEAILSPSMEIMNGTLRPAIGATINDNSDTSKVYAAARWETSLSQDGFFAVGLGVALHDGNTGLTDINHKALGSSVLFHIPIEAGIRFGKANSLSLYFDHMSNAGFANANEGMDTLGIRYGYLFGE